MGVEAAPSTARELLADGLPADTPAALVFDAGGEREAVERARLDAFAGEGPDGAALPPRLQAHAGAPALFIVGEVTRHGYARDHGALRGRRVLLTCSAALQDKAAALVLDWGGRPVRRPLIRAVPEPAARDALARLDRYAWLVVTSPSAVRGLAALLREAGADLRRLPRVMVTGPGTAAALEQELGVRADLQPAADFGAAGIVEAVAPLLESGRPVLRLRSDKAGGALAAALRARGIEADDLVLYRNEPVAHAERPEFDDVFFASASAVEAFASLWGVVALEGRTVAAIGAPTAAALQRLGRQADVLGYEATVEGALDALAAHAVNAALATKEEA
jgi:uroporphyrinogen-III synthase